MDLEKISVSMCVYAGDNPLHFDIALGSVFKQTLLPSEIVLTVDGPISNETEQIIDKYLGRAAQDNICFKVIRLKKNMGHGEARRICFNNCSHDLIALMDADDISVTERFEKQIAFFKEHPDLSVVGGFITEFVTADNPSDISRQVGSRIVPERDNDIKNYMQKRCPMNQVTVMFKKEDVTEVGGYIDWYCEEDYYLWIRLALAGKKFGNLSENLVNVRVGEEMYQRRGGWKYFRSEAGIQKLMFQKKMIGFTRYAVNVGERFVLQVLMTNSVRGWVFQRLARR